MDLIAAQETPNDFGDLPLHNDHHERKSSHAFRTISEVSDEIDVPQHVLRFWESKFAQIRPLKRGGGRRYYRPEDIELLKRIKNYLYKQGYTIKGVQRLLKEKRSEAVANFVPYANPAAAVPGYQMPQASQILGGPISVASYLQAAAAAPSALAMAYGSIGGQIAERASQHHFTDAFEQSTIQLAQEDAVATDQMEKSLLVVTKLHDEIATPVQPIRIANPSAPTFDDMADAIVSAAADALEFNFETPVVVEEKQAEGLSLLTLPLIPDYEVVASSAAPLEANVEAEAFEDEEFNQDSAEEEISVKRLDDACEAIAQEVATYVPLAAPVEARIEAPAIAPEKKEQLLGILAEMVALRDMLHAGI